jgi:hypothetical protein
MTEPRTADEQVQAVLALKRAVEFLDKCRADRTSLETGAMRDASEWLESAAREVVHSPAQPPLAALLETLRRIATMQPIPGKSARMRGLVTHIQSIAASAVADATGECLTYGIDQYHLDRERPTSTKCDGQSCAHCEPENGCKPTASGDNSEHP